MCKNEPKIADLYIFYTFRQPFWSEKQGKRGWDWCCGEGARASNRLGFAKADCVIIGLHLFDGAIC